MRLKYFLAILLLMIGLLPIKANDISLNIKDNSDITGIIKNSLELNLNTYNTRLINQQEAEKLASDFVDRLYLFFTSESKELDVKELEYLTRTLKTDIINLATKKDNISLLQTFIGSYHKRSMIYTEMQTPLDLFLSQMTSGEDLINTIKIINLTSDEKLLRQIVETNVNSVTWADFINYNRKDLLVSFMKGNRSLLRNFSLMVENSFNNSISKADRSFLTRISIINDMASIVEHDYIEKKQIARYGYSGERVNLRANVLQNHFGRLKREDAKFLNEVLIKTNPSSLEKVLPEAKGWIQGLTKWTRRSLTPKGTAALSIGAMAAITVVGELIKNYSKPSDSYLSVLDEINDSLETKNYVNLVYKSVYDDRFAQVLDTKFEEDFDEEEQIALAETLILFNRAMFDVFFQETNEKINKQIYNCFTYGTDCEKA